MNYKVVEKEQFFVVGKAAIIDLENKYTLLPQFWEDCKKNGTIEKLHELGDGCTIIGAGENVSVNNAFKYMIGVEAEQAEDDTMQAMTIPKSTWVIFEPVLSEPKYVGPIWEYIFNDFLPNGKYDLANTPDLEVNRKIDEDSYTCEIWIPVVEKPIHI